MAASSAPRQADLDRCVHCGLCLQACPTYREWHVEMDSPRGRIYQMTQVKAGAPITGAYREHIDSCLACRACETACPSGVKYGRLIEAARAEIVERSPSPLLTRLLRAVVFERLLPSRRALRFSAAALRVWQAARIRLPGRLGQLAALAPRFEPPYFDANIGRVFPPRGKQNFRVAFLSGCIANVCFARLNEATVRVLQANGCEVTVPAGQTCCGALHVPAGLRESTLKEYNELLEQDARAEKFANLVRDVTEFLASIEAPAGLGEIRATVTYQDSCHLAHGQKVRSAPRRLLARIPGLTIKEMRMSDACCGSAGIYNVTHTEMSLALLRKKMEDVNATGAERIVTANPGCMLQLRAGVERWGRGQRVLHVVEILDEALRGGAG